MHSPSPIDYFSLFVLLVRYGALVQLRIPTRTGPRKRTARRAGFASLKFYELRHSKTTARGVFCSSWKAFCALSLVLLAKLCFRHRKHQKPVYIQIRECFAITSRIVYLGYFPSKAGRLLTVRDEVVLCLLDKHLTERGIGPSIPGGLQTPHEGPKYLDKFSDCCPVIWNLKPWAMMIE
jgi:hypothetical protein